MGNKEHLVLNKNITTNFSFYDYMQVHCEHYRAKSKDLKTSFISLPNFTIFDQAKIINNVMLCV